LAPRFALPLTSFRLGKGPRTWLRCWGHILITELNGPEWNAPSVGTALLRLAESALQLPRPLLLSLRCARWSKIPVVSIQRGAARRVGRLTSDFFNSWLVYSVRSDEIFETKWIARRYSTLRYINGVELTSVVELSDFVGSPLSRDKPLTADCNIEIPCLLQQHVSLKFIIVNITDIMLPEVALYIDCWHRMMVNKVT
jgi:hypothetical protein